MKGRIGLGKKSLSKAFIRIYTDSSVTPIQKFESDIDGWIAFQIPLQKFYTIRISKQGYVTKIITVDAHMPKSQETGDFYFEFSVELFENIERLDVSMLKDPVAKIFFNTFTKKFDYDYNYTAKINNDLKKMYHDYDLLKKQGAATLVASDLKEKQKTENAFTETEKKSILTPPATVIKSNPILSQQKVVFSIQIFSSSQQEPSNSIKFQRITDVKEMHENGKYHYHTGEFSDHSAAEKMLESIKKDFPNAFIIAFVEGIKISDKEARDLMSK